MKRLLLCIFILWATPFAYANLTPEQQEAKQQGIIIWNRDSLNAAQKLEPAAKAGDLEAQHILADVLSYDFHTRGEDSEGHDAVYWFSQSAEKGFLPSMLRIAGYCHTYADKIPKPCHGSKTYWIEQITNAVKPKAEQGDAEAMLYMYAISFGKGIDWLEKAAKAGNAEAQYQLAETYYKQAENAWFLSSSKEKEADALIKKAADQGHAPALYSNSLTLYYNKNYEEAKKYLLMAVDKGYLRAVESYANNLAYGSEKRNIKPDPVQAYVFMSLLGSSVNELQLLNLTPEQQKEAEQLLKERKEKYPPLSKYKSFIFY